MKFRVLAGYFQKLESTPSRNAMVEILSHLFRKADLAEIDKIAYLLQGRVAPLYEPIEFQMADKTVIKAVAKATGRSEQAVVASFKKSGDLGTTAGSLSRDKSKELSIGDVFLRLRLITEATGTGSVEKKIELLANLLENSDTLSAKYIVRIVLDKLRLGFSDMTILEGLSWMIDGTKTHKPTIEAAYNIRPDLGFIAESVKRKAISAVKDVKPKVGTPILSMRAERLTSSKDILEKTGGKCSVEPKFDGIRLQLHAIIHNSKFIIHLFSRGLENVTSMYPDIVAAAQKELNVDEAILDGEAIGFDPKTGKYLLFQETVQRKRKYDIEEFAKSVPLKYIVFDCLYLNGESYINKAYTERRQAVEKLIKNRSFPKNDSSLIIPAEMHVASSVEELDKIFADAVKHGLEGIMAKKLDGVYQAGARGWNWIKLKSSYTGKLADTIDAVVMALDFGQGKRSKFGVGAFLVGVYDQKTDTYKTVSKIGTGLTDQEWRELSVKGKALSVKEKPANYDVNKVMACDLWLKPKLVGEFLADEITKSPMHTAGYALRFPRLVQWRDKQPEDSTSLTEIREMARLQKR